MAVRATGSSTDHFDVHVAHEAFTRQQTVVMHIDGTDIALCSPVWLDSDITAVLYVKSDVKKITDGAVEVAELLATSCGFVLKLVQCHDLNERYRLKYDCLLSISNAILSDYSVDVSLGLVVKSMYALFRVELVTLYLCDHAEQEAWICISKDGLEGLTFAYGQGIAGTVAMTGETILVEDAYSDSRFISGVDEFTGVTTKTMLCAGIPSFGKHSKPVAVIQLINKGNGNCFDEFDRDSLVELTGELSKLLQKKLFEVKLLKMASYLRNHPQKQEMAALELDLLNMYGTVVRNPLSHFIKTSDTSTPSPTLESACGGSDFQLPGKNLFSWDFVPFNTELIILKKYLFVIFELFDCLETFNLCKENLENFFGQVAELYSKKVRFHNFEHAWSVCHISAMILIESTLRTVLDTKWIFSILLAALCHDLDHPGNSNSFEVNKRTELAIVYSDDAVLERHHAALAYRVITSPDYNLLANISAADARDIRCAVTTCIMGTEMAQHFEHLKQLQQISEQIPELDLQRLDSVAQINIASHLVHCADLSGQIFDWNISLIWFERCLDEFKEQAVQEIKLNLPLTQFMHGLDDKKHAMLLQAGFIDTIVFPLWRAFADCFPTLEDRVTQCKANSAAYRIEAELTL